MSISLSVCFRNKQIEFIPFADLRFLVAFVFLPVACLSSLLFTKSRSLSFFYNFGLFARSVFVSKQQILWFAILFSP